MRTDISLSSNFKPLSVNCAYIYHLFILSLLFCGAVWFCAFMVLKTHSYFSHSQIGILLTNKRSFGLECLENSDKQNNLSLAGHFKCAVKTWSCFSFGNRKRINRIMNVLCGFHLRRNVVCMDLKKRKK